MNHDSGHRHEQAKKLRAIIMDRATGGVMDNHEYEELRSVFMDDAQTKKLLPAFVRDNLNNSEIWAYLKEFHTGAGAYDARSQHIRNEFQPLINHLSEKNIPLTPVVSSSLSEYGADAVNDAWQKALVRRVSDPQGAITAARTLLEEVCRHILEDNGVVTEKSWGFPKLYHEAAKLINLAPSQHSAEQFKQVLGGCTSVVEGLTSLRNSLGDAHGGGRKKVRPSARHASLAVNLSGSMAMFLIETWENKRSMETMKRETEAAERTEKQLPITYKGVELSSRYDLAGEIEAMMRFVDFLPDNMVHRLEAIFCDSKAGAVYNITVRNDLWDSDLKWFVNEAILGTSGGHNGVFFDGDIPEEPYLDPYWLGDGD